MKKLLLTILFFYVAKINAQCPTTTPTTNSTSVSVCQGAALTLSITPSASCAPTWYNGSTFVNNIGQTYSPPTYMVGTTVYSVYDSTALMCKGTSALTITVTVNASPNPPTYFHNIDTSFCNGSAATLTVIPNAGSVALWHLGNVLVDTGATYVVPTNTVGSFAYSVIDSSKTNGCTSSYTLPFSITILALPAVTYTLIQDPATPHTWDAFPTYSGGTTPYTYSWNWGDASVNSTTAHPSHVYTSAGTYSICSTITDVNGCSTTYCQNDAVSRLNNNNSVASSMVNVNVLSGSPNIFMYQKLLDNVVTEFDNVQVCMLTLMAPNQNQQTQSTCVDISSQYAFNVNNGYYAQGDSVYNGKKYKKFTYQNQGTTSFLGLMREDTVAKKVFFIQYCNTNEELLYNFAMQIGDTITYKFIQGSTMPNGLYTLDSVKLQHDYTTYYHRHFYYRNHTIANNPTLEMIEGVGNVSSPLFLYYKFFQGAYSPSKTCTAIGYDHAVSCKWNNGTKVYTDSCTAAITYQSGLCSYCLGALGGIEKLTANELFTIVPNPSNVAFIIQTQNNLKQFMQLYDVRGKQVLSQTINGTTTIDVNGLDNGVYFIQLKSEVGISTQKIIVQH